MLSEGAIMSRSASTEDADSARCLEIPGEPGSIITSLAVNEEMGHIWAGTQPKSRHFMNLGVMFGRSFMCFVVHLANLDKLSPVAKLLIYYIPFSSCGLICCLCPIMTVVICRWVFCVLLSA